MRRKHIESSDDKVTVSAPLLSGQLFESVAAPFFPECTSVSFQLFVSLPLRRSNFRSEDRNDERRFQFITCACVRVCVFIVRTEGFDKLTTDEGFGSGCDVTMATELTAAAEGCVSSPCLDGTEAQTLGVLSERAQAAWQVSPEPD